VGNGSCILEGNSIKGIKESPRTMYHVEDRRLKKETQTEREGRKQRENPCWPSAFVLNQKSSKKGKKFLELAPQKRGERGFPST